MILVDLLMWAARALVFASAAGLLTTLLRVKRAAVLLTGWTIVLYGALAMPVMNWVIPDVRWSIPVVLPSSTLSPGVAAEHGPAGLAPAPAGRIVRANAPAISAPPDQSAVPSRGSLPVNPLSRTTLWRQFASAVYLTGVFVLLLRAGTGWAMTRRLARHARPVDDADAVAGMDRRAKAIGLRRAPRLLEADALLVPITISVRRPAILLPTGWRRWEPSVRDAVLTHELAHIARRDVLTQRLSLLYRAIFWFSPLSWWLRRRLADLAEDASDEAVLDTGADREAYAEMLLGFFAAMKTARGRAAWQAVAMARGSSARRRVQRILAWQDRPSMRLTPWLVATMVAVMSPMGLIAATVSPVGRSLTLPSRPMSPLLSSPVAPGIPAHPRADVVFEAPRPQPPNAGHTVGQVATNVTPAPALSFRVDGVYNIVIARDGDGKTVTGLKAEDFKVFEDGAEQTIQVFSQFIGQLLTPRTALPPPPSKDTRGRLFMILVDDLNTPGPELASLRITLETIRDTVLRDDDLVGVVSTGSASISIDPQYDREHVRLNQAIAKLVAAEQAGTFRTPVPADGEQRARVALSTATNLLADAAKVTDLQKALIYVTSYPRMLSTMKDALRPDLIDRSTVKFAEADFIRALAEIIRAAKRAGVTFFLSPQDGFPMGGPTNVRYAEWGGYVAAMTTTLRTAAENTADGRGVVPNEPSTYYLIGYTSANHDLSKATRRVEIQTTRPGIQLDYRREYVIK